MSVCAKEGMQPGRPVGEELAFSVSNRNKQKRRDKRGGGREEPPPPPALLWWLKPAFLFSRPLYVTVVYQGKYSHCMRIGVAVPLSSTVFRLRDAVSRESKIPADQVLFLCGLAVPRPPPER